MRKKTSYGPVGLIVAILLFTFYFPAMGASKPCAWMTLTPKIINDTAVCQGTKLELESNAFEMMLAGYIRSWRTLTGDTLDYEYDFNQYIEAETTAVYIVEIERPDTDDCIWRDTVKVSVQPLPVLIHDDTVKVCYMGPVDFGIYIKGIQGQHDEYSYVWTWGPKTYDLTIDDKGTKAAFSLGSLDEEYVLDPTFLPMYYYPKERNGARRGIAQDSSVDISFYLTLEATGLCEGVEVVDTLLMQFRPGLEMELDAEVVCLDDADSAYVYLSGLYKPGTDVLEDDIDSISWKWHRDKGDSIGLVWRHDANHIDSTWSVAIRYPHPRTNRNVYYHDTLYVQGSYGCELQCHYVTGFAGWPHIEADTVWLCPGDTAVLGVKYPVEGIKWAIPGVRRSPGSGDTIRVWPTENTMYIASKLIADNMPERYRMPETDTVMVCLLPKPSLEVNDPAPCHSHIVHLGIQSSHLVQRIEWSSGGELAGTGPEITDYLFETTDYTAKGISADGCTVRKNVHAVFSGKKRQTALERETHYRKRTDYRLTNLLHGEDFFELFPRFLPDKNQSALDREKIERYIEDLKILTETAKKKLETQ